MDYDRLSAPLELSQNKRLLHLETALPSATLVVQAAEWVECVSGHGNEMAQLFDRFFGQADESLLPLSWSAEKQPAPPLCPFLGVIDAVSGSGHLELKALIGEQVSLGLMLEDGSHRIFHGYVVMAANLGSDNGRTLMRLGVASFTHFMFMRQDSRVFVQQTAQAVVESVLSAYPQAVYRFELGAQSEVPLRGITMQHAESDAAFVARLLAEEGWNWYLEHQADGPPLSEAKTAKHCLVITDARLAPKHQGAYRFSRPDVRQASGLVVDTLTHLSLTDEVRPNAVTLGAWDPGQLAGVSASKQAAHDGLPPLELYLGGAERAYAQHAQARAQDDPHSPLAETRAQLMLEQHRLGGVALHGAGAVRRLKVFDSFGIESHARWPDESASRHRVLSLRHQAANNTSLDVSGVLHRPDVQESTYLQSFHAVPVEMPVVPPQPHPMYAKPVLTSEIALVSGWDEEAFGPVTTNRDLQLRIQFPWQRGTQPVAGGLPGPITPRGDTTGHAPGTAASSVWVRVAQPSAGPNWGATFLPRQGTEVLVEFVSGDCDRPIIVGQLHNARDLSPWPVDEGANHAGVLSGIHTHSHKGAQNGINQWVMDDTTGQLRTRLASWSDGSPWSELSMGYIISQGRNGTDSQRGVRLGAGYYLHTDGWGVIRSHEGLLLSTSARPAAYGSAQGTQMDAKEAVERLTTAQKLGTQLNEALASQGAASLPSHRNDPQEALQKLMEAIDGQKQGKYAGNVGGQETQKTQLGSRALDAGAPVERFNEPHIVLETPNAALFASPAAMLSYSGQDTSVTAQSDMHLASAQTIASYSGQTTSFYTHEGPLRLITSNNAFSLQAHKGELEILSDKFIMVHSINGEVHIQAQQRIELISGNSSLVLDGSDIEYHCNEFVVHSSSHDFEGAASGTVALPHLPT